MLLFAGAAGGYIYFKTAFKPAPNQLTLLNKEASIPFFWQGDTMNHVWNPYAAMLLPVSLEGCPETFYMQFDLGAPSSLFYKNKLDAINQRYQNLSIRLRDSKDVLENIQFVLGGSRIKANSIAAKQFDSTGIEWNDTSAKQIIGTIGTDVFEDKVLVIDYAKNTLLIGDAIPARLAAQTHLNDFKFESRRVLLPAVLNGKKVDIFFDSGTSAFELMTDKNTWEQLAKNGAKVDRYPVRSWAKELTVTTTATDYLITFNRTAIPLQQVTYVEGTSFLQRTLMKLGGVGGLTGNKLFIGKIVILDTKNRKFDIID